MEVRAACPHDSPDTCAIFPNQARQHAAQPEPFVVLHPDDAAPRGVEDGAAVRIFNERGAFTVPARVSDDARPGVAVAPMGWWNADYDGARSSQATTPQRLTQLQRADLQRQPRRGGAGVIPSDPCPWMDCLRSQWT